MSRIGIRPVIIPDGVSIEIKESELEVKGKNATLSVPLLPGVSVKKEDNKLIFSPSGKTKQIVSNWGTLRALVANAVKGVEENFSKELIVEGIGFRVNVEGKILVLGLGFSHPVNFEIPDGVEIKAEKNVISISGPDKALVGNVAAEIKNLKKPEPYKGKGIRYSGEFIKIKAGKKAVGSEG